MQSKQAIRHAVNEGGATKRHKRHPRIGSYLCLLCFFVANNRLLGKTEIYRPALGQKRLNPVS
jgi:hypothetical protein